ncbi:MAG: hypothetical protein HQ517_04510 [SAR324 cluster bacterium]|nr:hypothetical protein [SAR324 cluster bacterium]
MKIDEEKPPQLKIDPSNSEFDPSVAFLQIPVKIKDQVKEFIDSLVNEVDATKISADGTISPFQSQGCFFVIALERIEEISGFLKNAGDPQQNDIKIIRAEVKKALIAIQGQ